MRIALDAMGTDAAPAVEVAGAVSALKSPESDFDIILVGDSDVLPGGARQAHWISDRPTEHRSRL